MIVLQFWKKETIFLPPQQFFFSLFKTLNIQRGSNPKQYKRKKGPNSPDEARLHRASPRYTKEGHPGIAFWFPKKKALTNEKTDDESKESRGGLVMFSRGRRTEATRLEGGQVRVRGARADAV